LDLAFIFCSLLSYPGEIIKRGNKNKQKDPPKIVSLGTRCRNRIVIRGPKMQDLSALVLSLSIHQWQVIKSIYMFLSYMKLWQLTTLFLYL